MRAPMRAACVAVSLGAAVLWACDPTQSGGLDPDAGPASDAGLTSDGGATPNVDGGDSASPAGDCPSGISRPSAAEVTAVKALLGTWGVTADDDTANNKRTLIFSAPLGDLECYYADHGGIDLEYVQLSPSDSACTHDLYRLRVTNAGKDVNGRYDGFRQGLFPDGGVRPNKEISTTWTFEGGKLYFDTQHYAIGSAVTCP